MMLILLCYIAFHLLCAVLAAGIFLADSQRRFPSIAEEDYRTDLGFAWGVSLIAAPIALLVAIAVTGFCQYGWMAPWGRYRKR